MNQFSSMLLLEGTTMLHRLVEGLVLILVLLQAFLQYANPTYNSKAENTTQAESDSETQKTGAFHQLW